MSLPSEEQWRPVPGYEGRYEVSNLGRVRSLPRYRGKPGVLRAAPRRGYRSVQLSRDSQVRHFRVNRLVAMAFIGPPKPGEVCRHLNGDSLDNRASNLAWGTDAENAADTRRMGRHNNARKTHCKNEHPFSPENTYTYVRPSTGLQVRICKTCHNEPHNERRRARRAAARQARA